MLQDPSVVTVWRKSGALEYKTRFNAGVCAAPMRGCTKENGSVNWECVLSGPEWSLAGAESLVTDPAEDFILPMQAGCGGGGGGNGRGGGSDSGGGDGSGGAGEEVVMVVVLIWGWWWWC